MSSLRRSVEVLPYTSDDEQYTKRSMPCRRALSSRQRVPVAFTSWLRSGCPSERRTHSTARWNTQPQLCIVSSTTSLSRIDPGTMRTSPCAHASCRLSREPVEKLSTTVTRSPWLTSASTRWLPMKPAPPVTRIRPRIDRPLLPCYFSALPAGKLLVLELE